MFTGQITEDDTKIYDNDVIEGECHEGSIYWSDEDGRWMVYNSDYGSGDGEHTPLCEFVSITVIDRHKEVPNAD